MKQITFSDKQFYDLLQFTSEYTDNIIERSLDWGDSSYAEELLEANQSIFNIHDFLCECKHKRLTLSPNEHVGEWTLQQTEEFNNDIS